MPQLSEGENMITVVATNGTGRTTTATLTAYCEPLRGDLNSDDILTPPTPRSRSISQPPAAGTPQQT
ncbi:hypothetical protein DRO03_08525 [Methanosarcinales archaeon]|nr:MAG: hypothetical protein DRO03_08525 [Methanosarcinales archaeon]